MGEIRNRVQESGIISMDLADFKPNIDLSGIDLKNQLWQEIALKEKDFRNWIDTHDWSQYNGKAVYIYCSADAIIPTWAYMLVGSKLSAENTPFVIGNKDQLEKDLIRERIFQLNPEDYRDGRIIIKGCSDIAEPAFAMTELLKRLQPVAKSIMYGEPCSAVPVFKRK